MKTYQYIILVTLFYILTIQFISLDLINIFDWEVIMRIYIVIFYLATLGISLCVRKIYELENYYEY